MKKFGWAQSTCIFLVATYFFEIWLPLFRSYSPWPPWSRILARSGLWIPLNAALRRFTCGNVNNTEQIPQNKLNLPVRINCRIIEPPKPVFITTVHKDTPMVHSCKENRTLRIYKLTIMFLHYIKAKENWIFFKIWIVKGHYWKIMISNQKLGRIFIIHWKCYTDIKKE